MDGVRSSFKQSVKGFWDAKLFDDASETAARDEEAANNADVEKPGNPFDEDNKPGNPFADDVAPWQPAGAMSQRATDIDGESQGGNTGLFATSGPSFSTDVQNRSKIANNSKGHHEDSLASLGNSFLGFMRSKVVGKASSTSNSANLAFSRNHSLDPKILQAGGEVVVVTDKALLSLEDLDTEPDRPPSPPQKSPSPHPLLPGAEVASNHGIEGEETHAYGHEEAVGGGTQQRAGTTNVEASLVPEKGARSSVDAELDFVEGTDETRFDEGAQRGQEKGGDADEGASSGTMAAEISQVDEDLKKAILKLIRSCKRSRAELADEIAKEAEYESRIRDLVEEITDERHQMQTLAEAVLPTVPETANEVFEQTEHHVALLAADLKAADEAAARQTKLLSREREQVARLEAEIKMMESRRKGIIREIGGFDGASTRVVAAATVTSKAHATSNGSTNQDEIDSPGGRRVGERFGGGASFDVNEEDDIMRGVTIGESIDTAPTVIQTWSEADDSGFEALLDQVQTLTRDIEALREENNIIARQNSSAEQVRTSTAEGMAKMMSEVEELTRRNHDLNLLQGEQNVIVKEKKRRSVVVVKKRPSRF